MTLLLDRWINSDFDRLQHDESYRSCRIMITQEESMTSQGICSPSHPPARLPLAVTRASLGRVESAAHAHSSPRSSSIGLSVGMNAVSAKF
jgi:hypothetical protein